MGDDGEQLAVALEGMIEIHRDFVGVVTEGKAVGAAVMILFRAPKVDRVPLRVKGLSGLRQEQQANAVVWLTGIRLGRLVIIPVGVGYVHRPRLYVWTTIFKSLRRQEEEVRKHGPAMQQ